VTTKQTTPVSKVKAPEPKTTVAPEATTVESPVAAAIPHISNFTQLPQGVGKRVLQERVALQLQRQQGNRYLSQHLAGTLQPSIIQRKEASPGANAVPAPQQDGAAVDVAAPVATVAPASSGHQTNELTAALPAPVNGPSPALPSNNGTGSGSEAKTSESIGVSAKSNGDKAPASPEEDPLFQAAIHDVKGVAGQQQEHEPAEKKSQEAQDAATTQPAEKKGQAQGVQAGEIGVAAATQEVASRGDSAPGFDKEAFKEAIRAKITMPEDPKELEDFGDSGVIEQAESTMQSHVNSGKAAAKGDVDDKTSEAPDEASVPEKEATPLKANDPGPPPPDIDATRAVPKDKTSSEVEKPLQDDSKSLDEKMASAHVTDEQLEKSNEPQFTSALDAKQESQEHAESAPEAYREAEGATIDQAKGEADAQKQTGIQAIIGQRADVFGSLNMAQTEAKGSDEAKRQEIGQKINDIYEKTKGDVEAVLAELDSEVDTAFSNGAQAAKDASISYIEKETGDYKRERYLGDGLLEGGANFLSDTFTDMPPEYYDIFGRGRDLYLTEMDKVLDQVADIVGGKISKAKQRVEQGRQEINEFVAQQPEELQKVAREAAGDIQSQFDELEQSIDNKQNEIVDRLAQQYSENLQSLDTELEAMKAADKGLWARASDALDGVIGKILEMKEQLSALLARAGNALDLILADPVGFLGNLVEGVKLGLNNFMNNIGQHLKEGFMAWLTGALEGGGIQLPETWDLAGIFQLVIQILGISFDQIMGKVSKVLGFDVMGAWTTIQDLINAYKEGGMGGAGQVWLGAGAGRR
jgi:hypothetical protein